MRETTVVAGAYPLEDNSGGKLKGWPGGGVLYPNGIYQPVFRPAKPGERAAAFVVDSPEDSVYCKYCYAEVPPLLLHEQSISGQVTHMTICSQCGAGLTPPEETQ